MRAADRLVGPVRPVCPAPEPESDPYIHAGGACRTWRGLARVAAAEALGSALLVALAPAPAGLTPAPDGLAPALAPLQAGLVVALVVQCLGRVSGAQANPAVSLLAWGCGRVRGARLAAELAAQLVGALAGAAARAALAPRPAAAVAALLPRVAPQYPACKALCVEALCALCLALGNCAQWRGGCADTWPLRAGALVAALVGFAGDTTGGVMNPARSFGPALLAGDWERHWVYWAGPLAGAAAACALWPALFPAPPRRREAPPEPPDAQDAETSLSIAPRYDRRCGDERPGPEPAPPGTFVELGCR